MNEAQPASARSYLYCVTYSQPFAQSGSSLSSLQVTGVGGFPARVITQGNLAAIVSDSPTDQYEITLENVRAHENVIEAVMQQTDVLPVSFDTVATSDREIQERLLQCEADALRSQLEGVKNRVEMGVKALWEQDAIFAQIATENSDIQALREHIVGTTPEETYDVRLELGELTSAAIERQRELDAANILNALGPLAVETRTNRIITDMMIVNAAFLVDKSQASTFTEKVNALKQANAGRMTLHLSGPLPPYNFVTVEVHWEEPSGATAQ